MATKVFSTGARRDVVDTHVRFDLVPPRALRRLAAVYAEGAKRYGDRNWELGIPASTLLNHAEAHLAEWKQGRCEEDYLAKTAWGLLALMEFECTRPDLFQGLRFWKPLEERPYVNRNKTVFDPILGTGEASSGRPTERRTR